MHRQRPPELPANLKRLVPLGNTLALLKDLPAPVRRNFGHDLFDVQRGKFPSNSKKLSGFHPAVLELRLSHDKESYRAVYTVALGDVVYLLHVFHKKSNTGISTPRQHLEIVRQRLAEAIRLEQQR